MPVRNETEISLLVIASQLMPLHWWGKVLPGETRNAKNEQQQMGVSSLRNKSAGPSGAAALQRRGDRGRKEEGVCDHTQEPNGAKVASRLAAAIHYNYNNCSEQ